MFVNNTSALDMPSTITVVKSLQKCKSKMMRVAVSKISILIC